MVDARKIPNFNVNLEFWRAWFYNLRNSKLVKLRNMLAELALARQCNTRAITELQKVVSEFKEKRGEP